MSFPQFHIRVYFYGGETSTDGPYQSKHDATVAARRMLETCRSADIVDVLPNSTADRALETVTRRRERCEYCGDYQS
jgi:hypothetical protein